MSSSSSSDILLILVEFGEDGVLLNRRTSLSVTGTQTLNENTKTVGITFFRNLSVEVIESEIVDFMLNAGSTALPYEPYTGGKPSPSPEYPQEIVSAGDEGEISITLSDSGEQSQSLTLQTPDGLPGIPVGSGGNFVDEDGQEWICNYRDWARGVDVQNIATLVYSSDDEDFIRLYWNGQREEQLSYGCVDFYVFNNRGVQISQVDILMCSHFPLKRNVTSGIPGEPGTMAAANRLYFRILLSTIGATASDDDSTLLQAVRNWLNTQLTLGTPVTAIVKITSPIETPIPAEELAAYRALHAYDGTTVLTPDDALAQLEVDYIVKPKAYIEKKLTAIEQKIQEVAAAQIDTQTGG